MEPLELFIECVVIVIFVLLKGFFSGSEIAMVNSDKIRLRHAAKTGDRGAALVLKLYKTPDVLLGTTLVTVLFIQMFGPEGDILSVLIATPFLLILGEIVPKTIYQQKADIFVTRIVYGLRFFSWLYYRLWSALLLLAVLSGDPRLQSYCPFCRPSRPGAARQ